MKTRWLYCVECPQYSNRLEALGYLCTSCLLAAFDEAVTWLNSQWWLAACNWVISAYLTCCQPASTSQKIWGGFLYGVYKSGEWLWIDSNSRMETTNPMEGYVGSEFLAICNHCGVMVAWIHKTKKHFREIFAFFGKTISYDKILETLFQKFSSREWSTCCVQISWCLADGKSAKSCVAYLTKNFAWLSTLQLSLLRRSCPKSGKASPRQCTQSAPDFIRIGSLSADL